MAGFERTREAALVALAMARSAHRRDWTGWRLLHRQLTTDPDLASMVMVQMATLSAILVEQLASELDLDPEAVLDRLVGDVVKAPTP